MNRLQIVVAVIVVVLGVGAGVAVQKYRAADQQQDRSRQAEQVAVAYETAFLAGDLATYCGMGPDPDTCLRALEPRKFETVGPVRAIRSESIQLTDPKAVTPAEGTGVVVQFQIVGQAQRQTAVFVDEANRVGTSVEVSSRNSSLTLTELLSRSLADQGGFR